MRGRAVGRPVVSDHRLDLDAVIGEVLDRSAQKPDRGRCLLVGQDLDIGEPGRVVDTDVDELPTHDPATNPGGVGAGADIAAPFPVAPTLPSAALDAPKLLDVDVDQLARPLALIANDGFEPEPS